MIFIQGAGGGGGGKGQVQQMAAERAVPQEADDSLQSVQFANVVDLIGEGEIEGIEGGPVGIYLDGVQAQNPNGAFNFSNFGFTLRNGTQAQSYIPLVGGVESIKPVSVEI